MLSKYLLTLLKCQILSLMGEGAQLGEEVNLNSLHMYSVPLSFSQTQ